MNIVDLTSGLKMLFIFAALKIQQDDFWNNDGTIAQMVEHRTENPGVPGSIPGGTTS